MLSQTRREACCVSTPESDQILRGTVLLSLSVYKRLCLTAAEAAEYTDQIVVDGIVRRIGGHNRGVRETNENAEFR